MTVRFGAYSPCTGRCRTQPRLRSRPADVKRSAVDCHHQGRTGSAVPGRNTEFTDSRRFNVRRSFPPQNETPPRPGVESVASRMQSTFRWRNHVDAILCRLQSLIKKVASLRFCALPLRMGVGGHTRSQFRRLGNEQDERLGPAVAKLIEFHIPDTFRRSASPIPGEHAGKVIEFRRRDADAHSTNGDEGLILSRHQTARSASVDVTAR